jgi:thioredoxin-like negative regulator of GroEL
MLPIFEDVAKAYGESVGFYRLDTQLNADIALKLNIRSIPTLIIFHRGQVFDVRIGLTPRDRLHKMVRRVLDKHQRVGLFGKLKRLWKKNA